MNRRTLIVVALLVVVVLGAYVGAARRTTGAPLDPGSTAPDGTKALVQLVDRLGGSLRVVDDAPTDDLDVALLLQDRLDRRQADELTGWIRRGGTLVVADPGSPFTPPGGTGAFDELSGSCAVPALEAVERLDVGLARTFAVGAGATGCFRVGDDEAFLVSEQEGEGQVISLGGPDLFTNELLGEADNPVLAAALLVDEGGSTGFLRPVPAGGGDRSLVDLVGTPVRAGLAQLVVAFGLVVLWRARRLGRPIEEPQPVRIEGSELTRAVGRLLENNRRPDRAAALLRDRARRELSGRLGLPLDGTVDAVRAAVAARTTLTEDEAWRAVAAPVRSDDDLVAVAHLLARIREELTHDRHAVRQS
jgi:hypothetical protein